MIVLAGTKGEVAHLAFSPDGRLLATSGGGRGLEMWDIATANKWGRYERGMIFSDGPVAFHPTEPVCFAYSKWTVGEIEADTKKGRMIAIAGRGLNRFEATAMTPDGSGLVCHLNQDYFREGALDYLRWSRGKELQPEWRASLTERRRGSHLVPRPAVIRVNPDGKTFLTLDAPYVWEWPTGIEVMQVTIRSMNSGTRTQRADVPLGTLPAVAFAPDGRSFVTARGNVLSIWETDDLKTKPRQVKTESRSRVTALAFHPSGKHLAAATNDGTVTLYDALTWKPVRGFVWAIGKLRSVCFSPDGVLAAAGSDTGKVVIWDVDM